MKPVVAGIPLVQQERNSESGFAKPWSFQCLRQLLLNESQLNLKVRHLQE